MTAAMPPVVELWRREILPKHSKQMGPQSVRASCWLRSEPRCAKLQKEQPLDFRLGLHSESIGNGRRSIRVKSAVEPQAFVNIALRPSTPWPKS